MLPHIETLGRKRQIYSVSSNCFISLLIVAVKYQYDKQGYYSKFESHIMLFKNMYMFN